MERDPTRPHEELVYSRAAVDDRLLEDASSPLVLCSKTSDSRRIISHEILSYKREYLGNKEGAY